MTFFIPFLIAGYLLGSLSSAIIVCRAMGLPDPRTQGSNNPGTTNVMRIGGKKASYTTFAGDFLKGLIPVLIARWIGSDMALAGTALGAFLGHLFPIYFGFKGGKGIATLAGIIIGISPWIFSGFAIIWLTLLFITGYVSLASMVATVGAAIITLLFGFSKIIIGVLMAIAILVIYRHRENIERLKKGTESQFLKKK